MGVVVTKDEVVWSKELSKGSRAHAVHGSWFQVDQDGSGDIFMCCRNTKEFYLLHSDFG